MKLSVIIPAYNEEAALPRLLTALKNQTYSDPYEIIVVDNNSTDKTAEVAKSFGVKVVHESQQGFGFAANKGFFSATGDILVRSDADSLPPPQWLERIAKIYKKNNDAVAIGGPIFPLESNRFENFLFYPGSVIWMYILRLFGRGFLFTNTAVKKEVFVKIGGFNPHVYGEDTDLCYRLVKEGKVLIRPQMYTFSSIRRLRSLGAKKFLFQYVIGNEIAKAQKKEITVGLDAVRTDLPYNSLPDNPWPYVYTLPAFFGILLIVMVGLSVVR